MTYSFEFTLVTAILMLVIGTYCLIMIIEDIPIRKR